ncbi:unnamed protein product, partial [Brassica rapa subsp. narinosa]
VSGCLKLLPPEELEHLDTLERDESSSPVKKLVSLTVQMKALLFVSETVSVHCGFSTRMEGLEFWIRIIALPEGSFPLYLSFFSFALLLSSDSLRYAFVPGVSRFSSVEEPSLKPTAVLSFWTIWLRRVAYPAVFGLACGSTFRPPTISRLWLGFGTTSWAPCLSPSGHGGPP